jgi:hypothetical protein
MARTLIFGGYSSAMNVCLKARTLHANRWALIPAMGRSNPIHYLMCSACEIIVSLPQGIQEMWHRHSCLCRLQSKAALV